jgi:hypothetical protein
MPLPAASGAKRRVNATAIAKPTGNRARVTHGEAA